MTIYKVFIYIAIFSIAFANKNKSHDETYELKMVHVIFRHGARTPATDPYPNDPYINSTYEPYGFGHMTNIGKQQMFELGEFLRNRYDKFLGKQLKIEEIYAQSSGFSRTKVALQLVLAGLFPPKNTAMEWNKNLNWQPIPYSYEEIEKDILLMVNVPCPRYQEEYNRIVKIESKKDLAEYPNITQELLYYTGYKNVGVMEFLSIYSTLKSQEELGLELPEWTHLFYPHKMKHFYKKIFVYQVFNQLLKRLKGGVFLKKIIEDWDKKIEGNLKPKFMVFSGHDITVVNLLSAMNLWELQAPGYGMTTMLELLQNKQTKNYGIRIYLRNSTMVDPVLLKIDGCDEVCPLKSLKFILRDNIPKNWTKECSLNDSYK